MSEDGNDKSIGIVVAFLDQALGDQEAGRLRPLSDYQARFPGFEGVIAAEYAKLQGSVSRSGSTEATRFREPLQAFEGAWLVDRVAGRVRPLSEYLRLFPGDDAAIAARHAELSLADDEAGDMRPDFATGSAASRLGHYRIDGELGRGGQGVVYRAFDERLGREVALKLLHPHAGLSPDAVERFRREAQIAARLDDPELCPVYEAGVIEGQAFIAMRLIEGRSLAELIRNLREDGRQGSYIDLGDSGDSTHGGLKRLVAWFETVARAVHRAHERGVLHRDLKPGNLFVIDGGRPAVLDFGLAVADGEDFMTLTRTGDVQGTLPYMSPEQVAGLTDIDVRTDVYSLGVTIYEAACGARPFTGATREALSRAIEREEPVALRRRNPAVPRDLETIVATAMAKEKDRRYASARDLADDLRRFLEGRPLAVRPLGWLGRGIRWSRRHPALAALLVLVAVAVPTFAGLGGFLLANLPAIEEKRERDERSVVDAILARAYFELSEGDLDRARAGFEEALRLDAQRDESLVGVILVQIGRGRSATARRTLEAAATSNATLRRLMQRSIDARSRSERRAILADDEVLSAPSDYFVAGTLAASDAHTSGDAELFALAFRHLEVAVLMAEEPVSFWYYELAHAAGHLDDLRLAEPVCEALLHRWPDQAWSWFWAGFAYHRIDRPRAARYIEEALKRDRSLWIAWEHLGDHAFHRGEFELAVTHYQRARALNPNRSRTLASLGQALAKVGRSADALKTLDAALSLKRPDPVAHYARAWTLYDLGRLDEAEVALRRYLELRPLASDGLVHLGLIRARRGRFDEALTYFRRAVACEPGSADAWRRLAQTQLRLGDGAGALQSYAKVVECAPEVALYHQEHGSVLGRAGREEEAARAFEQAVGLDPRSAKAWFGKGVAHRAIGEPEAAAEAFGKVTQLEPDNAPAWCQRGRLLVRLERFDEAVLALRRGHELGSALGDDWHLPSGQWLAEAERRARESEATERNRD